MTQANSMPPGLPIGLKLMFGKLVIHMFRGPLRPPWVWKNPLSKADEIQPWNFPEKHMSSLGKKKDQPFEW